MKPGSRRRSSSLTFTRLVDLQTLLFLSTCTRYLLDSLVYFIYLNKQVAHKGCPRILPVRGWARGQDLEPTSTLVMDTGMRVLACRNITHYGCVSTVPVEGLLIFKS